MKTIIILLFSSFLIIHSPGYSQRITYSGEGVPLKVVFSAIQKQAGYGFFYDKSLLNKAKPVTLNVQNRPVSDVLDYIFENQALDYSIENKTITVSKKKIPNKVAKVPVADTQTTMANVKKGVSDSAKVIPASTWSAGSTVARPDIITVITGLPAHSALNPSDTAKENEAKAIEVLDNTNKADPSSKNVNPGFLSNLGNHRKALFVEGSFLSTAHLTANFDMRLNPDRVDGFGVRGGLGTDLYTIIAPLGVNYLLGKKRSSFEAGLGILVPPGLLSYMPGFINVGYRYQPVDRGLMFRATWTKFTSIFNNTTSYDPMISFSVGYSFNKLSSGSRTRSVRSNVAFSGHKKYVFGEFLGNGILASINYDVRLKPGRNDGFGLRAGAGFAGNYLTFPIAINYIAGKNRSGFETGFGITPAIRTFGPGWEGEIGDGDGLNGYGTGVLLNAGYRLQSYNGFMVRVNASLIYLDSSFFAPFPGISIGYRLNKAK